MGLMLLLSLILSASCILPDGSEANMSLQVVCRSSMYPISVECFWTESPASSVTAPTKFIATYRVGEENSTEITTCFQPNSISLTCFFDEMILLFRETHMLNVTAINPEGITTTLVSFVPEDIIKPDPPVIVRVSPVSENHLEVQWYTPWSWPYPDKYRLKYQLRYKPCKSKCFRQAGPTDQTSLIIKAAHQKCKYCFQVNAQHFMGYGEPSDWSIPTVFPITSSK